MLIDYTFGQTGVIIRAVLRSSTTGLGLTTGSTTLVSSGLIISTICDVEGTATAYSGTNISAIATPGTFVAPTAGKCSFSLIDTTNHPGLYEIQITNSRLSVTNAKYLIVTLSGATGVADTHLCIPLRAWNPYDSVRGGLTALPAVAQGAVGCLPTADASGRVTVITNNDKTGYSIGNSVTVGGYASGQNPANYILSNSTNKLSTDGFGQVVVGANNDKTGYSVTSSVVVGGYSVGQDPATMLLTTPANKILTDSTGRVTIGSNTDKTGYAISGNVTVGGYATGFDPATFVLANPTNKLVTNSNGKAAATLTSADVTGIIAANTTQWNGSNVDVMPGSGNVVVGGYATGMDPASLVLANTGNKLTTDANGRVTVGSNTDKMGYAISGNVTVGGYASGFDPATLVLANPTNKLVTNSNGKAAATLAAADVTGAITANTTQWNGANVGGMPDSGNVVVGGYATGMDPASLVLATPTNKLSTDTSGEVLLSMGQAVPLQNTPQTIGDALNAARAQGFGQWMLDSNSRTLRLFGPDGTTVVRMFTLDSVTVPTART